jgi:hypothetical protein
MDGKCVYWAWATTVKMCCALATTVKMCWLLLLKMYCAWATTVKMCWLLLGKVRVLLLYEWECLCVYVCLCVFVCVHLQITDSSIFDMYGKSKHIGVCTAAVWGWVCCSRLSLPVVNICTLWESRCPKKSARIPRQVHFSLVSFLLFGGYGLCNQSCFFQPI